MYIEVKGIPGSGKSFLVEKIVTNIGNQIIMDSNRITMPTGIKKILINIRILLKLNVSFMLIIRLFIKCSREYEIKKSMFICLWKNIKKIYLFQQQCEIKNLIIDEGITHPISILDDNQISEYYEIINKNKWLKDFISNTVFIYNKCDYETCYQRIINRNQPMPHIYMGLNDNEIKNLLKEETLKTEYQTKLMRKKSIEFIEYNNGEEIIHLLKYILNRIV